MTAKELYKSTLGFKGFMRKWIQDRRCPFPLADYLMDLEMWAQAECAKWCVRQPDRLVYIPIKKERGGSCGVFPTILYLDMYEEEDSEVVNMSNPVEPGEFVSWGFTPVTRAMNWGASHLIPISKVICKRTIRGKTATDAILTLLDSWKQ